MDYGIMEWNVKYIYGPGSKVIEDHSYFLNLQQYVQQIKDKYLLRYIIYAYTETYDHTNN